MMLSYDDIHVPVEKEVPAELERGQEVLERKEDRGIVVERGTVEGVRMMLKQKPEQALKGWDRLTILIGFHHEHLGDAPFTAEVRTHLRLETQDQPFLHKVSLEGIDWQELDYYWLKQVGFIVLVNQSKEHSVYQRFVKKGTDRELGDYDQLILPAVPLILYPHPEKRIELTSSLMEVVEVKAYFFPH